MNATSARFGLDRIGQIAINVHDVARATAFYRDTLGMRHLFDASKMAFFDCGGVRLMLSEPSSPEFDHAGSILYYKVADIDRTYHVLAERGVVFEQKPHLVAKLESHDLWLAFFRDPDNNLLGLMCELPR
ncbi:MAG: VOC family protein [bacterium]